MTLTTCTRCLDQCTYLFNRLNRTDLIVSQHHRYQDCVRPQRLFYIRHSNQTIFGCRYARDFPTVFLQRFANASHGWMLNRRGNNVTSVTSGSLTDTPNGEVVGFSSPGHKNDLVSPRCNQRSYVSPRSVHGGA